MTEIFNFDPTHEDAVCYKCGRDLHNPPDRIWLVGYVWNGTYYCEPCYRKANPLIDLQLKYFENYNDRVPPFHREVKSGN